MFDFATTDLCLAIVHHLLVFLLAGVLAFEVGVICPSMKREDVLRVSRVDNWYGILAAAILVVGFSTRDLCRQRLGLLRGKRIPLGQDRGLRRGRPAFGHSDDTDHSLAPRPDGGSRLPNGRIGHYWRQTLFVGRGGVLRPRSGLRRRDGPRLWSLRALRAANSSNGTADDCSCLCIGTLVIRIYRARSTAR
jgi:hypothetical protein